MTPSALPSDRLEQRLSRWQHGDPEGVLDDQALVEAAQLWWVQVADVGDDLVDPALHVLAWLHWARFRSGPPDERQIEQQCALGFFRVLWQRRPTAPPPEIQQYFRGAKSPTILDIEAHTGGILCGIAVYALTRHRDTGIRLFALAQWPPDLTADAAPVLLQVAMALAERHAETSDAADLDAAATYAERALALVAEPDLLRAKLLQNVAILYSDRFEAASAMSDIDRSLALTDEALAITRALSADPAHLLANRGNAQWRRFVAFQHLDDLRQAVADGTAAVNALPPESQARAAVRAQVTRWSQLLLLHPDNPDNSEVGTADHVSPLRAALASATGDAQETLRTDLGLALAVRYEQSRQIEDLQEAIRLFRDNTPGRSTSLLATALRIRFDVLGDAADLDECISLFRRAGTAGTRTDEWISEAANLAEALEAEYQVRPDQARLHAAIDVGRTAVLTAWPDPTAPEPNPGLLPTLESLAQENLRRRLRAAKQTGNHDFLLSSEAMTDAAYLWWLAQRMTARDPASPSLTRAHGVLGHFHILRHNATVGSGRPDELAQTLMHWLPAPESLPHDVPEPLDRIVGPGAAPKWQARYANTLINHASQNQNPAAVNAAILLLSAAVEATRADDPELSDRLGWLSDAYLIRGVNDKETGDVDIAERLAAEAVALAPSDAARQRERLARTRSLQLRFAQRTPTPDPGQIRIVSVAILKEYVDGPRGAETAAVMDAAVQEYLRIAQAKEPATDAPSSGFLAEFRRTGLAVDLELALRAAEAETVPPDNFIERLGHLLRLSAIRFERYTLTRENTELAEAASPLEEALNATSRIGPYRSWVRILLGEGR